MVISDGNKVLEDILINSSVNESIDRLSIKHPITNDFLSNKDKNLIENFFKYVYLIDPDEISENPVIHPEFVRIASDKETYSKPKYLKNTFQGRKWSRYITINGKEYRAAKNNVRAKYAFRDYTNVNLTNDKAPNRLYGYTVAHIFGGADNPFLFSAGFNLALILDGFVKFTDEQHLNPEIYWALTSATYLLNQHLLENSQRIFEMYEVQIEENDLAPLFPEVVDGKIQKEGFKIKFRKVAPFSFWFSVNIIKKIGESYKIVKVNL